MQPNSLPKGGKRRAKRSKPTVEPLHANKLYLTLKCLNLEDRKQLLRFIRAPYFNQSPTMIALCEFLLLQLDLHPEGFNKQKAWAACQPKRAFQDINFRKMCSDLLDLVEQFMAVETIFTQQETLDFLKLDYINNRKVLPLYSSAINQGKKKFGEKSFYSSDDYFNNYLFEKKIYALNEYDVKLTELNNIADISEYLDVFYIIEKLKLACTALTQKKYINADYDIKNIENIIASIEKFDLGQYPIMAIYYYTYLTRLDEDNTDYYFSLKKFIEENTIHLDQKEAIEMFDSVLNYCIRKVNKGDRIFLQEYFDWFVVALSHKVFVKDGILATSRFNNIVITALRLGKLDWATQFVEDNQQLLPVENRANMVKFNRARVAFYKKNHAQVLDQVRDVEFDDIFISLVSKTLLVMSYYELDELEVLGSFLDSFRTFINRQKEIPANLKITYLNLVSFVRKLIRVHYGDSAALDKLAEEAAAARTTTVNIDWLLEKIKEARR
jgi:hypothetical protein